MSNHDTLTNTFGTAGQAPRLLARLTDETREAFHVWLANHTEVQEAATSLREPYFTVWLDNNAERLLREFERATR